MIYGNTCWSVELIFTGFITFKEVFGIPASLLPAKSSFSDFKFVKEKCVSESGVDYFRSN